MLTRRKMRVPHAVKRDNATIFFSRRRREARDLVHLGKTFRWWSVRFGTIRVGRPRPRSSRAPRSPAPMRPTNFQWRRQRVVVAARLLLNLQVWKRATRRRALPKLIQKKRISPPRNNRSRAARRLSPARARQPHALSGSILEPCRSHPSRLIDHPLAQRTTVPFST